MGAMDNVQNELEHLFLCFHYMYIPVCFIGDLMGMEGCACLRGELGILISRDDCDDDCDEAVLLDCMS